MKNSMPTVLIQASTTEEKGSSRGSAATHYAGKVIVSATEAIPLRVRKYGKIRLIVTVIILVLLSCEFIK